MVRSSPFVLHVIFALGFSLCGTFGLTSDCSDQLVRAQGRNPVESRPIRWATLDGNASALFGEQPDFKLESIVESKTKRRCRVLTGCASDGGLHSLLAEYTLTNEQRAEKDPQQILDQEQSVVVREIGQFRITHQSSPPGFRVSFVGSSSSQLTGRLHLRDFAGTDRGGHSYRFRLIYVPPRRVYLLGLMGCEAELPPVGVDNPFFESFRLSELVPPD